MYFKCSLHRFYDLEPMAHIAAFLPHIKLEQLQVTVLKRSRDLGKTISDCKRGFHYYRPDIFSKLL